MPTDVLAQETAMALADFVGDDASLLIACKSILARQPTSAVMVWLVAHVLGAPNQRQALWHAVEALEADSTADQLGDAFPDDATVCIAGRSHTLTEALRTRGDVGIVVIDTDGSADHLVDRLVDAGHRAFSVPPEAVGQAMAECTLLAVELLALGPERAIAAQGTLAAASVARHWDLPVWGIAPIGSVLPAKMYNGLTRRWHENEQSPLWLRPVEEVSTSLISSAVGAAGLVSLDQAQANSQCPIVAELF